MPPGLLSSASPNLEEVRFTFDVHGFVLLPAVLPPAECQAMVAEVRLAITHRDEAVASGAAAAGTPLAPGLTRPFPNTNELALQERTRLAGSPHPSGYYSWLSFGGLTGGLLAAGPPDAGAYGLCTASPTPCRCTAPLTPYSVHESLLCASPVCTAVPIRTRPCGRCQSSTSCWARGPRSTATRTTSAATIR
jgi:hypothetical protein